MKNFIWVAFSTLVMSVLLAPIVQAANLNNFTITDYDIKYNLSKDDSGRSTLKTTETITANFPPNQNRGIERAIPRYYKDHPTSLDIVSVEDETGKSLKHTTYNSNDNLVVRIGDKDRYVSGSKTYVITYDQRDVTSNLADKDEFYWDTNGTGWRVPIEQLSVTLNLDSSVADAFDGNMKCYQGRYGASQECQLMGENGEFTVAATDLSRSENITVALGFQADTFAEYELSLFGKLLAGWVLLQIVLSVVAFGLIIWLAVRYSRRSMRRKEHDPIAPEYLPPKDSSIEISAKLMGHNSFAAQIIDLAVRHYIKIREVKAKTFWVPAEYELEVVKSIDDLRTEEREFMRDLFSGRVTVGSKLNMKTLRNNTAVYRSFQDNTKKNKDLIRGKYALRHKQPDHSAWFKRTGFVLLGLGIITLSPMLLLVSLVAFIQAYTLWPLTDKGLALIRYLKGLKMYIKAAEAERLKMLQSPEGAEKVGDTSDEGKLVKLYERVLPYAVLFGVEKDWNKQLGVLYESTDTQPDWYSGYHGAAFSGAAFSNAMSSFNSASNYSSQSSSSSGGSSGGGFSGGGGGGGGGGGW